MKFEQKLEVYIAHLYEIFKDWVGTPPRIRNISGGGAKNRQSFWFRTYRHDAFTLYKKEFYKTDLSRLTQYKVVPKLICE